MKFQIISLAFLGFSHLAFSQIKEEQLILDRKREPEVRRIEKKKTSVETVKNYPPQSKKTEDSLSLKYEITDIPAVSDFKTSTIEGADISPKFSEYHQDSYLRFGMGNYGKILGDANFSKLLESKMEVGADVHYLSTTGLKNIYPWKSAATNAEASAFLNNYGEKGKFNLNAEYDLDDYNYYGIYALNPASDIDLKQKVGQFKVNGNYDFYQNEILDYVSLKSRFLTDYFDAKEHNIAAKFGLSKDGIELPKPSDSKINLALAIGLENLKSDFALLSENSTNQLLFSAKPEVKFFKEKSYLKLGAELDYLNSSYTDNSVVSAEKTSKFLWAPNAEILFHASDEIKFYAGVDGGLRLNSYASLLEQNPYLVSDQVVRPTHTKYHFYVGMKGDIDQSLKYDFNAGYGKVKDAVFFQHNDIFDNINTLKRSAYNFANTFSAVYGDGDVSSVKASLEYFPLQNLSFNGDFIYKNYKIPGLEKVYGLGGISARLGAKYKVLNDRLLLGAAMFFNTGNDAEIYNITESQNDASRLVSERKDIKVGGFADLNLSAEYKVHKNFSIFAIGNNLLNTKYQNYYGYKNLGAQVTGGIKISF